LRKKGWYDLLKGGDPQKMNKRGKGTLSNATPTIKGEDPKGTKLKKWSQNYPQVHNGKKGREGAGNLNEGKLGQGEGGNKIYTGKLVITQKKQEHTPIPAKKSY